MIDITHYLKIIYSQYNKGYPFLNCWGLVCEFYHREKGITLDSFSENDLRNLNCCFISYRKELKEIQKNGNVIETRKLQLYNDIRIRIDIYTYMK